MARSHTRMWFYIIQTMLSTVWYPVTRSQASFHNTQISLGISCSTRLWIYPQLLNMFPALEVCCYSFAVTKSMVNLRVFPFLTRSQKAGPWGDRHMDVTPELAFAFCLLPVLPPPPPLWLEDLKVRLLVLTLTIQLLETYRWLISHK